jgi:hypothetical protein
MEVKMSGEEKQPLRLTELGQSTVVRLGVVFAVVIAVASAAVKLGSIDEKISQISSSGIEKRLTTIEVTNLNIERRLMIIEAEVKVLATAKRAELRYLQPTSVETTDKSRPQQLLPIQWPP